MTMRNAIASAFRQYFVFSGRARRSEYWFFFLFEIEIAIVIGLYRITLRDSNIYQWLSTIETIITTAILIPRFTLGWRRLHDIGKSGGWAIFDVAYTYLFEIIPDSAYDDDSSLILLLLCVVVIWKIIYIIWMAREGQSGPNKYGPDPKAAESITQPSLSSDLLPNKTTASEIKYCRECGKPIEVGSVFCKHCGKKLL